MSFRFQISALGREATLCAYILPPLQCLYYYYGRCALKFKRCISIITLVHYYIGGKRTNTYIILL